MKTDPYSRKIKWWTDARFSLFIHWGPVSLAGTEIGWSRQGQRRGHMWEYPEEGVPVEEYDVLYKRFNPVNFNADEWVAIAKAAGMKYLVFTTKQHDGFCMFDSALTEYKRKPLSEGGEHKEKEDTCGEGSVAVRIAWAEALSGMVFPLQDTANPAPASPQTIADLRIYSSPEKQFVALREKEPGVYGNHTLFSSGMRLTIDSMTIEKQTACERSRNLDAVQL